MTLLQLFLILLAPLAAVFVVSCVAYFQERRARRRLETEYGRNRIMEF